MFEKEAEEYRAKRKDCQYFSESYKNRIEKAFKDGAEFGYNKANEWHYDEVPDITHKSCLISVGGLRPVRIAFWNCKVWKETLTEEIHNKDEVKAWKYLDFPKESE